LMDALRQPEVQGKDPKKPSKKATKKRKAG
jgi:hypothetical protein